MLTHLEITALQPGLGGMLSNQRGIILAQNSSSALDFLEVKRQIW